MKKWLLLLSIVLLILSVVALVIVAAVPVNTVDQTTTGVAGVSVSPINAATPVTNATNLLYATMFGGVILLTVAAITVRHKIYSFLQSGRHLIATVCTKWKTHGSRAVGDQLLFPMVGQYA